MGFPARSFSYLGIFTRSCFLSKAEIAHDDNQKTNYNSVFYVVDSQHYHTFEGHPKIYMSYMPFNYRIYRYLACFLLTTI